MTPVLVQAPFFVFTRELHQNLRLSDQEFQPVVCQKTPNDLEICKGDDCVLRAMIETFTKVKRAYICQRQTQIMLLFLLLLGVVWSHGCLPIRSSEWQPIRVCGIKAEVVQ